MPQLKSTAFPRHEKKARWGINNGKTNATHEFTDTKKKKELWTTREELPWNGQQENKTTQKTLGSHTGKESTRWKNQKAKKATNDSVVRSCIMRQGWGFAWVKLVYAQNSFSADRSSVAVFLCSCVGSFICDVYFSLLSLLSLSFGFWCLLV